MTDVAQPIASYSDIEGWFNPMDKQLFDTVLAAQADEGTLVEIGAFMGRSAVVIEDHRRPNERFVVVDLFGSEDGLDDDREDSANRRENAGSYPTLTRDKFEANFLALHPALPEVVQGLSTTVVDHVEPKSARFVHIDASHMYDKVAADIVAVKDLMQPDGVVVFDDYRATHTPGVAAATWEAVFTGGLKPFAASPRKLYATWGDAQKWHDVIVAMIADNARLDVDDQPLGEHTLARIHVRASVRQAEALAAQKARAGDASKRTKAELAAVRKSAAKKAVADERARVERKKRNDAAAMATRLSSEPTLRSVLRDWAPPAVTRIVRKRRAAAKR